MKLQGNGLKRWNTLADSASLIAACAAFFPGASPLLAPSPRRFIAWSLRCAAAHGDRTEVEARPHVAMAELPIDFRWPSFPLVTKFKELLCGLSGLHWTGRTLLLFSLF